VQKQLHRHFHLVFSTDLIAPLALIFLYIVVLIIIRGVAPTSTEIIEHAQALYSRYGYELIFFGAAFEGLVLVNFLAPGSLTVGLGAVFASTGTLDLTTAVFAAILGVLIAYIIDYFLGLFGFSKVIERLGYSKILEETRIKLENDPVEVFSVGFIHPNIGAVISLAAGASRIKFWKFLGLAAVSTAAWMSFWGILIYILGEIFLRVFTRFFPLILVLVFSVWILSILYGRRKSKVKN
jgi:membrane protein DedA with SNARE-associated domain